MTKKPTLYRGYEIIVEFESGEVMVYKGKELVHKPFVNHKAAYAWIDEKKGPRK